MTDAVDPIAFRAALGSFVTGVTIVTATAGEGQDVGVTANSFNSVSLDPPMVLWSLARKSSSLAVFEAASHFAVHVLAADQEELSNRFARPGDKFASVAFTRGAGGAPLLEGAAAQFQCRTAFRHDGGDHVIFVGEVEAFERSQRPPLAFHGGRYALAARKAADLSSQSVPPADGTFGEDFVGYLFGRAHFQAYALMQPVLERLDLTPRDHFAVSALGLMRAATPAQLEAAIGYTGEHVDPPYADSLVARGLAERRPAGELALCVSGRNAFVELAAAAMAIEESIADALDESEMALLRHLLKRAIHATDPGLPDMWAGAGQSPTADQLPG